MDSTRTISTACAKFIHATRAVRCASWNAMCVQAVDLDIMNKNLEVICAC